MSAALDQELAQAYTNALAAHRRVGGEETLVVAYELGRRALAGGLGLVELALLHHAAMWASPPGDAEDRERIEAFAAESLTPFEMSLRGYQDANAALLRVNQELSLRNSELEAAKAKAEAASRELEAFSYSVSHDLRAPLRATDAYVSALLDEGTSLDEGLRHYAEKIQSNTGRMGRLIEDLLRLARVARANLHYDAVNLTAVARAIVQRLREAHPHRVVDVHIQEELNVVGDARLLEVALDNLIGNAWKFTSHNETARIEVGSTTENGEYVVFVRDDGAGFDPRQARRLFLPFQRLHPQSEFEGTGIGLATVQRIVTRHGGRVWAEGREGGGATIYLALKPVSSPSSPTTKPMA